MKEGDLFKDRTKQYLNYTHISKKDFFDESKNYDTPRK